MVKTEWGISPREWKRLLGYEEDKKGFFRVTPEGDIVRPVEIFDGKLVVDNSRFAEQRLNARERT